MCMVLGLACRCIEAGLVSLPTTLSPTSRPVLGGWSQGCILPTGQTVAGCMYILDYMCDVSSRHGWLAGRWEGVMLEQGRVCVLFPASWPNCSWYYVGSSSV